MFHSRVVVSSIYTHVYYIPISILHSALQWNNSTTELHFSCFNNLNNTDIWMQIHVSTDIDT